MENSEESLIPIQWILGNLVLFLALLTFIGLLVRKYIQRIKKESELKLEHQQVLLENSIEIQERERNRIASEIHDNLIAQLYQVKLLNNEKELSSYITNSIQTARNISHELSPPLIENHTLEEVFEAFLFPLRKQYEIEFLHTNPNGIVFDNTVKLHLFRIFQEVITNIQKHAKTEKFSVSLKINLNYVLLVIKDFGVGFQSKNITKGLGSKNIELRAKQIHAHYKFKENKPHGSKFLLAYDYSI
ncbi:hypothetical protein [Mesonia sp.]|uniref:sensor histidine kinase n=1 Tax=Mesonia sp. TaxID=1960830 RepID=UPI00175CA228|nr:hypothetical protein [Mesonia sp.]HIB38059.1 histidine kinase [Mesonia sp.]HIO27897.1 histidine kinase [Flavobacteriaceae bacterium]